MILVDRANKVDIDIGHLRIDRNRKILCKKIWKNLHGVPLGQNPLDGLKLTENPSSCMQLIHFESMDWGLRETPCIPNVVTIRCQSIINC